MNGVKSEDACRIESISMKFDVFMKKVIRGRVRNAVRDYIKQMDRFPLWSTNAIESIPAPLEKNPIEQYQIRVGENDVYLQDEQLVDAIEGLARRLKEVLLLSVVFEYSSDEIGKIMNLDRDTILKYRQLALKHLRKALRRRRDEEQ